jgi:hypothetical protein
MRIYNLKSIGYIFFKKFVLRYRRQLLSFIIASILLYIYSRLRGTSYNEDEFDSQTYKKIYDDSTVGTSSYLLDYGRLLQRSAGLKAQLDAENSVVKVQLLKLRHPSALNKTEYLIYEYTKVIGVEKYCPFFKDERNLVGENDAFAKEKLFLKECPFTNCRFSCDSSHVNTADMLLFHEGDLKQDMKANSNYLRELNSKVTNRARQIWLLYNDEVNLCD